MAGRTERTPTPIEFQVGSALYDPGQQAFAVKGVVDRGVVFGPQLKLSVAFNQRLALELPILRISALGETVAGQELIVWVALEEPEDTEFLTGLAIGDELALIWNAGDAVDVSRHFAYGETVKDWAIRLKSPQLDD